MTSERDGARGFTLLELLVVIAVLAGAAALVGPRLGRGGGDGVALRVARTDVAAQLATAREATLRDGHVRCLAVPAAPDARGCDVLRAEGPVSVLAKSPGIVRFHGDGSSNGLVITLASGAGRAKVSVVGATGQIAAR